MTAHLYHQLAKNFSKRDKIAFEQPDGVKHSYADVGKGSRTLRECPRRTGRGTR